MLDDEPMYSSTLTRALRPHGIEIDAYDNVEDFMRALRTEKHDAILLDWCLRTCEGTELCARLRSEGDERPIGIVSGKLDLEHGRDIAEAAGANCYIEKPSRLESVVVAIRALLCSTQKQHRMAVFHCAMLPQGAVTVKLQGARVVLSDLVVNLRPKEYELFEALLQRAGHVVLKEELARLIWGSRSISTNLVETWMSRLRVALEPADSIIETVRGGYRISFAKG